MLNIFLLIIVFFLELLGSVCSTDEASSCQQRFDEVCASKARLGDGVGKGTKQ